MICWENSRAELPLPYRRERTYLSAPDACVTRARDVLSCALQCALSTPLYEIVHCAYCVGIFRSPYAVNLVVRGSFWVVRS